jgi:hypothetical protein
MASPMMVAVALEYFSMQPRYRRYR